jgi:hypothetical protein
MKQRLAGEGFTLISFTGEGEKTAFPSRTKHNASMNCG